MSISTDYPIRKNPNELGKPKDDTGGKNMLIGEVSNSIDIR